MEYRDLGRTGWKVSAIGVGTWAMGSAWGPTDETESFATLNRALDLGVNFFDTADVWGSEHLLGRLRKLRSDPFYVATEMGIRLCRDAMTYTRENVTAFVESSLWSLGTEAIDLLQLHIPPVEVLDTEVFTILDDLVRQGKVRQYGVSVRRVSEARRALEFPGVQSVQLVFNVLRQRPAEEFFDEARRRGVGVIARVPLASGLLTGKMTPATLFSTDDHRSFNRQGEAFDKGETFSGVDFQTGLSVVEELRALTPAHASLAQTVLRWILMFDAVSCAIPGARHPAQVEENASAADMPALSRALMDEIRDVYESRVQPLVHDRW